MSYELFHTAKVSQILGTSDFHILNIQYYFLVHFLQKSSKDDIPFSFFFPILWGRRVKRWKIISEYQKNLQDCGRQHTQPANPCESKQVDSTVLDLNALHAGHMPNVLSTIRSGTCCSVLWATTHSLMPGNKLEVSTTGSSELSSSPLHQSWFQVNGISFH